jgi:hypothetical protein
METKKLIAAGAIALSLLPLAAFAQTKPELAKEKDLAIKPALKPDLVPTDIRVNADCQIVVSFKNNGPGLVPDAAFSFNPPGSGVQMYNGAQPWGGIVLGGVDPQKNLKPAGGTVTHTWFPGAANLKLGPGIHSIKVDVDNNNKVAETNEGNNSLTKRVSCEAPKPDLQPTDLSLSPDCHIVLTLKNNGPGAVPATAYGSPGSGIQMYKDGQPWGGIILSGFDPSKQVQPAGGSATKPWFPGAANLKLPPGTHSIKVDVDNNGNVAEANEGNNSLTRRLTCGPGPIIEKTPGGVLKK